MPFVQRNGNNDIIATFNSMQPSIAEEWLPADDPEVVAFDPEDYKQKRQKAYGSFGEQLDMIYWDQMNDTTVWRDHITAIKALYPAE